MILIKRWTNTEEEERSEKIMYQWNILYNDWHRLFRPDCKCLCVRYFRVSVTVVASVLNNTQQTCIMTVVLSIHSVFRKTIYHDTTINNNNNKRIVFVGRVVFWGGYICKTNTQYTNGCFCREGCFSGERERERETQKQKNGNE